MSHQDPDKVCVKEKTKTFFFFFGHFSATLMAYGGFQARGLIGAVAIGIRAMLDPNERGQ